MLSDNGINAIEVRGLCRSFQEFALQDVSFDLPKGCILGLIGENGAGKSTTIRLIMNSLTKDKGTVRVLGVDNDAPGFCQVKNDLGVVLDEAYFPAVINAAVVDKMMAQTYERWSSQTFRGYIRRLNLPEKQPFKEYSRGMKMKLAIAVALSHDPKLLILDEATSGLDPIVRDEILDIFNDFTRDPDHSILMSSHILSDLEKLCDYVAYIHQGRLLFCEEKDQLLERYGLLATLLVAVIQMVSVLICHLTGISCELTTQEHLIMVLGFLFCGLVLMAVNLPILFRIGSEKGRTLYLIVTMVFAMACSTLIIKASHMGPFLWELSPAILAAAGIVIVILCQMVSIRVSIKAYTARRV